MSELVQIITTVQTQQQATQLARQLVQQRLVACVQIDGPIQSVYQWQDALCESTEYRCTAKTLADCVPQIEALVASEHPYDLPEFLVLAVTGCSPSYAAWVAEQVA